MNLESRVMLGVVYGFLLGLSIGIILETSGSLEALDRALADRLYRPPEPQSEPTGGEAAAELAPGDGN